MPISTQPSNEDVSAESQHEYSPFKQEDKHYFSAFFNLAENNLKNTLGEFKRRTGGNENDKGMGIINNYFKDNLSHDEWERGVKLLASYFPVIAALHPRVEDEPNENDRRRLFRKRIEGLIVLISDLRNFYTHYQHPPITVDCEVFELLDTLLLHATLDVKKQRFKTDKTKLILKESLKEELQKKLDEEKAYQEKNKIPGCHNKEQVLNTVLNNAFKHLLYKPKSQNGSIGAFQLKDCIKAYFQVNTSIDNVLPVPLSQSGMVFLLSLFLSRKETEDLMGKMSGYKRNDELKYIVTRWVYTSYCFKGLKHTLSTTFTNERLLAQMVDVLSKVPNEQYRLLGQSHKDEFLEDMNEYYKDNEENEENLENSQVIHPVIRKRYEDQFSYFALRFLDEFANFPNLRFQVCVGNYVHDAREKTINGINLVTNRVIKEPIMIFGKLGELSTLKGKLFSRLREANDSSAGWEEFPNPSYAFSGNNIGISFLDPRKLGMIVGHRQMHGNYPVRNESGNKKTREKIVKELDVKLKTGSPFAYLSINELPALLYELLVKKKSSEDLEQRIIEKISAQFTGLNKDECDFPNKNIPKNLRNDKSDFQREKLIRDLERDIRETEEKLALIAQHRNEIKMAEQRGAQPGKRKRRHVFTKGELGKEATWLANDFKRHMNKENRKSWKGYQHAELQRVIAFYSSNKPQLISFLKHNLNLDSTWGKTVMGVINRQNFFEDFYQEYLQKRSEILKDACAIAENRGLETHLISKDLKKFWSFYDGQRYRPIDTTARRNNILTKPINLPRGLFDDKPSYIKGANWSEEKERFADWFNFFMEHPSFQSFYALPPDWNDENVRELVERELTKKKQVADNERKWELSQQREYVQRKLQKDVDGQKKQDLFLKLMADHIFSTLFRGQTFDAALGDLYQTRKERRATEAASYAQHQRQAGDTSPNIRNERFIWNRPVKLRLFEGRIVEEVKIKDVGKFRKLENDVRIKEVLTYDTCYYSASLNPNWNTSGLNERPSNAISEQIAAYEKVRSESLLKKLQGLEASLLQLHGGEQEEEPDEWKENGNPRFWRYLVHGLLLHMPELPDAEKRMLKNNGLNNLKVSEPGEWSLPAQKAKILIILRNKFSHNQMPTKADYDFIQQLYPEPNPGLYAAYFDRVVGKIVKEFREILPRLQLGTAN
ncbi:MAG: type VI-B CRISPR-associated RNA-guided ribonuclease Cas13b [Bacteroidetes bacterium]|nr:type VI-B CRISPR-associated RNA-guided ribonuclease Cas13b [Bacteroidota bacterium]MBS1630447.1 type VI-B CRISPR-associated RNA-guided ribonuclease Cas13b [Bacteroidota bacterium]